MGCSNCGSGKTSDRYTRKDNTNEEAAREQQPLHPDPRTVPGFEDMNSLSYETLVSMKNDVEAREKREFFQVSDNVSEAMRAMRIRTLVRVFNGDEFSPAGISPKAALCMLSELKEQPAFISIFEEFFPGLARRVDELYNKRITLPL